MSGCVTRWSHKPVLSPVSLIKKSGLYDAHGSDFHLNVETSICAAIQFHGGTGFITLRWLRCQKWNLCQAARADIPVAVWPSRIKIFIQHGSVRREMGKWIYWVSYPRTLHIWAHQSETRGNNVCGFHQGYIVTHVRGAKWCVGYC